MIQIFTTIALSIFLEGLFFLLIGAIVSSIIEVFVSVEIIKKIIPENRIFSLIIASCIGIIFPVCECGIVSVIHRLLKKGVPLYICVTILLSSPIVNLTVIASTYFAFRGLFYIVLLRVIGGFIISFIVGFLVGLSFKKENVIKNNSVEFDHNNSYNNICCHCDKDNKEGDLFYKIKSVINHSINEFFDTGKYFIFGIIITSLIQSLIPRENFTNMGHTFPLSNLFMIIFPYIISNCSNTDAFIARSFLGKFSISSIVVFMTFGAMFDIKTTIMLKKVFNINFIIRLLLIVISLNFLFSCFIELYMFLKG